MTDKSSFTIIYASQTGQAKSIAENIYDLACANKTKASLYCMSDYETSFELNKIHEPVVFVISTTGDGETPETATKCFSRLKSKTLSKTYLENLHYALLGLGYLILLLICLLSIKNIFFFKLKKRRYKLYTILQWAKTIPQAVSESWCCVFLWAILGR
jgi:flavodoxin